MLVGSVANKRRWSYLVRLEMIYLVDPDRCSEEPADVNLILRSAKNTKDVYRTIREQSGTNGKDWSFFYRKDWKWFNQLDAIYSADL